MTTASFKRLQARWYRRLRKNGFEDIESGGVCRNLWTSKRSKIPLDANGRRIVWDAVTEYYRWAEHVMRGRRFRTKQDREVWRLHASGMSKREIARLTRRHHTVVVQRIFRIERYLKQRGDE